MANEITPPPYFAFRTLLNTIERMEEHGPPTRIDRSFLSAMSGAGQSQFMAGLRSLGLISEDGTVQPRLAEMVNNRESRKQILGEILREHYPEAVELGTKNATTGELVEVFRDYGVQGDTARKAIAFYLKAAQFAEDVPLSPHFKTPSVKGNGRRTPGAARPRVSAARPYGGGTPSTSMGGLPPLHPALAGVLADLPPKGTGWTAEDRERFMTTFRAVVDYAIPIVTETDGDESEDEEYEE